MQPIAKLFDDDSVTTDIGRYRNEADHLRQLAATVRLPGVRRELIDLADKFDALAELALIEQRAGTT